MATITGQRARSALPAADTPDVIHPAPDGLSRADAEAAWRAVVPSLAGTPHVRISKDGGRTYPARHAGPLPAGPPASQPCTVPVYDEGAAAGRLLALDLDPGRVVKPGCQNLASGGTGLTAELDAQAAGLGQLLKRLGARYAADVAPSGGRHLFILFAGQLPWCELRDAARAMALRFPAIDTAPMSSLGGQISPPGFPAQVRRVADAHDAAERSQGGHRASERARGMGRPAHGVRGRAARDRGSGTARPGCRQTLGCRARRRRRPVGAPPRRPRPSRR